MATNEKKEKSLPKYIFILITLILVVLLAGLAWAKYQSILKGQAKQQVATWYFDLKDKDGISITSEESKFSLTRTDGNTDSIADKKIAPGTYGEFEMRVDTQTTDVMTVYNLKVELVDCPTNLKFYIDRDKNFELQKEINEEKSTEAIKVEELNISRYLLLDSTKPNYVDGVHTEKIYWEWPLLTGNTPEDIYKNDLEDSKWINKDDIKMQITAIGMQAREPEVIDVVINNGKRYSNEIKGRQLKSVAFNTTEDTTSIMDAINGIKYADGWYYVSGNDIEGMQLESSYIVNYETGEKIKFDNNVHRVVDNNLLCVKEGLVYSVDPKNMGNGNNWGNAILHNFNEGDENSGWSENSLMFDGIDDGIEVEDSTDYSNGITIEMYIKAKDVTDPSQIAQILIMKRTNVNDGFFMFLNNNINCFGLLAIDIGGAHVNPGDGANRFYYNSNIPKGEPTYITYTFNPNKSSEKGILYINGKKIQTTDLGRIENLISVQYTTNIQIGSDIYSTLGGNNNNYPFNGEIYAARVYSRPLTAEEVAYNYNNTKNANN